MSDLNVKVGDEVIESNRFGYRHIYTVEAITPKGFIKVNGHLYYKNGLQRGSDEWHENTIYAVTPEEAQAIKRESSKYCIWTRRKGEVEYRCKTKRDLLYAITDLAASFQGQRWENLGDVNFLAYGGSLVRPHWSKEELEKILVADLYI